MKNRDFRIHGLDCAEEVKALKQEVGPRIGGEQFLAFDILQSKMTVLADARAVTDEHVLAAVRRSGMRGESWAKSGQRQPPEFWQEHGRAIATAASGVLLLLAFVLHATTAGSVVHALSADGIGLPEGVPIVSVVLYALSLAAGVRYVLPKAWSAARALRPDMNLLMVIAVSGAVVIGEWLEAATVAFLFALALLLESWSVGRARRAVQSLLESAPPIARIKREGIETEVPPDEVEVGSLLVIRPGEKVPLDGTVVAGCSELDQAPITGESVPVPVEPGSAVFAGTINGDGLLEVRTTRTADQTTLASIIRLVTQAHARRSPSEQWVEKFARVYTPAVLLLAALVFVAPPILLGGPWTVWFYRALVMLVIACPCALVISTPVSIVAALTRSARQGVLVKGGLFMEAPARLNAVAFDKTGTLTQGRPQVTAVVPMNGYTDVTLLNHAAALESGSNHPLALAIVREAERRGLQLPPLQDHHAIPGQGVTGRIDDTVYWAGSSRYLVQRGQESPQITRQIETLATDGQSVIVVGTNTQVCGLIALADRPRPEACAAIAALHDLGIRHVVMLTGDNRPAAEAVARELGIDHVHAELLPEDKVGAVEALVRIHGKVAMVGDGVNDAPALAVSSLGIAMGAAGSDAAIETADIALMADDLSRVPWLVSHSRRTLKIIRQNIALAIGLKVVFVILTLLGVATLWMAIAADMGASLAVTFNGLRLLRKP